ncbi:LCP family protein [Candidatus Saccharibacteria bacterium]|nr:LCP family protein [Candidatus Saccharibacteria bacterium]
MDNFRRPKRSSQNDSVDGFVRRRMRGSHNSLDEKGGESVAESRIGNFSRAEGFKPRKTGQIKPDGRSLGRRKPAPEIKLDDISMKDIPKNNRKRPKKNWKKMAKRTSLGLAMLVILIGGYLGLKGYLRAKQIFQGGGSALAWDCNPDPAKLTGEGDGRVNFLLLGKGGPEQSDGPDLTDTIIVASLDPCNKEAGLLSIPRDLAVKMDSGETTKINAVYALTKQGAEYNGKTEDEAEKEGIEAIEKSVENITGIPINFYTMIDFTAFEQAVNSVGGIEIDVQTPVYEQMSLHGKPYTLDVETGVQQFDGLRALAYSRSRYTSDRGDFSRSERQREIIVALQQKVFSLGTFSNPVKISQLMDSFGGRVTTNLNIPDDVSKLYEIGQEIGPSQIKSVSLVDEPNVLIESGSYGNLGSIQVPVEGIFRYDDIQRFVRTTFVDGFIKKENPGIIVLNGTTVSSLAKNAAEDLQGYGYNVIEVGDAPTKDTTSTIVVDLGKKDTKYTKRYLELRYGTTATKQLPEGIAAPEGADFVIIMGQDEAGN